MGSLNRFKPVGAMIVLQFGYAALTIMARAALTGGMSPYVFVVYRQAVATLAISPFAYFIERNKRPPLTFDVFFRIFLLSLIGITINQNLYFKGLYLASSSFASATSNSVPAMTFLMAALLGLEKINMRCRRGQAKVIGTIVCVGGAMTMGFYKGPIIRKLWPRHLNLADRSHYLAADSFVAEDWKLGSLFLFASCLCWSIWIIMQASTVKKYPAQLSLTAIMCFMGASQSALLTLFVQQGYPNLWTLQWNFDLLCIVYSGIVTSGIAYCVQTWCIHKRGPVFVAMFNPLLTVIVAILASTILHEKLYVGSVCGAVLIVGGLYAVLWGKENDDVLHANDQTNSLPEPAIKTKSIDFGIDIAEPLLTTKAPPIDEDTNTAMNK